MLVYYIIRNLMLIWRGKGQTNELWRISWQRRAETAFAGELPAGQDLALLSSLRRGGLRDEGRWRFRWRRRSSVRMNGTRLRRLPRVPQGPAKQHPDVITVDDTEHKNVAVDIVRQARSDVFIRPNEGRKRSISSRAGRIWARRRRMRCSKILEEPPEYAVFLILTTSAERLLPTIRSRAVQLQLSPLSYEQAIPELKRRFPDKSDLELADALEQAEGYLGPACEALRDGLFLPQALALANGFAARDGLAVLQALVPMEKTSASKFCRFWSRRGGFCAWRCAHGPEALFRATRCRRFCAEERVRSSCRRPRRCKRRRMT